MGGTAVKLKIDKKQVLGVNTINTQNYSRDQHLRTRWE